MDRAVPPSGTGTGSGTGVKLPVALDQARISGLPATAYYIPDFISEAEEAIILDKVRLSSRCRGGAHLTKCAWWRVQRTYNPLLDRQRAQTALEATLSSTTTDLAVRSCPKQTP